MDAIRFSKEALLVRERLASLGLETPMTLDSFTKNEKIEIIQNATKQIMSALSLDMTDDSLSETPQRVAKMFIQELFSGLDYANFPTITTIANKMYVDEEIVVKNISFTSTCEHHLVVFDGMATIGYVPKDKVIGLSKINRIVRFFAKRPQVQERLTSQVFVALQTLLGTQDVFVEIEATHYCVKSRGVEDITSSTMTSKRGGKFK